MFNMAIGVARFKYKMRMPKEGRPIGMLWTDHMHLREVLQEPEGLEDQQNATSYTELHFTGQYNS